MKKSKLSLRDYWQITRDTFKHWNAADPFRESAIVAYYAIFSLPALLVIIITFAGIALGEDAAQGEVSTQISSILGKESAKQIEQMIEKAGESKSTPFAAIIGIVTLLVGATGVFAQLQKSLNNIWEVQPKPKQKWLRLLRDRLFSFGLILSIGFLMLISLMVTSMLSLLSGWLKNHLPDFMLYLFFLIEVLVSLGGIALLFAMMFKILPDARIRWRNVWLGSVITAILFVIGKFLLGLYFGNAEPASAYGAAGSVVLVLLWVSYSSMILFFGAEFTKQYTLKREGEIRPADIAEAASDIKSHTNVRTEKENKH